jgi:acylphosphatase
MIDESVYILATGTETQLQELIQWCYTGSPKSRVEKVEANEEELQIMKEFTIKR